MHLLRDALPEADRRPRRVVWIGFGSPDRGDDAAGLLAVERLLARAPPHVLVKEVVGDGTQVMEAWFGFDRAVVIDAVKSGAAPGAVHRLDGRAMPPPGQMRLSSTHSIGLAEALKLAERLGELPREVEIIGIEGEQFGIGAPCSEAVLAAIDQACELLLAEETL